MKTSLFIPFHGMKTIAELKKSDREDVLKEFYENLVRSGPAYRLVVLGTADWVQLKDELPEPAVIETISVREFNQYVGLVDRFLPTEIIRDLWTTTKNMDKRHLYDWDFGDLRNALLYILIGNEKRARIFYEGVLDYRDSHVEHHRHLSETMWKFRNIFSEDIITRVRLVEKLVCGYKDDTVSTLSINENSRTLENILNLFENDKVKLLSEKHHLFSEVAVRKNILKRQIGRLITQMIKNEWFPYVTAGATLAICYAASLSEIEAALSLLSGVGAKMLAGFDFREFMPAVQEFEMNVKRPKMTVFFSNVAAMPVRGPLPI